MQSSSNGPEGTNVAASRYAPSFPVTIALVVLALSLGYALLFSHMIYVSMQEQHWEPRYLRYRFEGAIHFHSPAEWLLLALPALIGWLGTIGSLNFLLQRWWRAGKH